MGDLISRQAAYETLTEYYHHTTEIQHKALCEALAHVPTAQPTEASCWGCNCQKMERLNEQKTFSEMVHLHDAETHEERTETHACDCISRQAAINTLCKAECDSEGFCGVACDSVIALENMPTAVQEPQDGTLAITVGDVDRVKRVIVQSGQWCKVLYDAPEQRNKPMKPKKITDRTWGIPNLQPVCPNCDYYLAHAYFLSDNKRLRVTYCETCGQAINWEGWEIEE